VSETETDAEAASVVEGAEGSATVVVTSVGSAGAGESTLDGAGPLELIGWEVEFSQRRPLSELVCC
jgi:hypothetical protein